MRITYDIREKNIILKPFEDTERFGSVLFFRPLVVFYRYDLENGVIKKTPLSYFYYLIGTATAPGVTTTTIKIDKDAVYGTTTIGINTNDNAANTYIYYTGSSLLYRTSITATINDPAFVSGVPSLADVETIINEVKKETYVNGSGSNKHVDTNFVYTQYLRDERDERNFKIMERLQREPLEDIRIANYRRQNIITEALLAMCQYYYNNDLLDEAVKLLETKEYPSLNSDKATRLSFT